MIRSDSMTNISPSELRPLAVGPSDLKIDGKVEDGEGEEGDDVHDDEVEPRHVHPDVHFVVAQRGR